MRLANRDRDGDALDETAIRGGRPQVRPVLCKIIEIDADQASGRHVHQGIPTTARDRSVRLAPNVGTVLVVEDALVSIQTVPIAICVRFDGNTCVLGHLNTATRPRLLRVIASLAQLADHQVENGARIPQRVHFDILGTQGMEVEDKGGMQAGEHYGEQGEAHE